MRSTTRLPGRSSLWQTAKGDFAAATGWKAPAVAGLLGWLAFQWGFGNDVLLPWIAANVFASIDDGENWSVGVTAVLAATLASFAFWAVSQLLDAVVVLLGLRLIPGLNRRLSDDLRAKGMVKPYAELRWSTRWLLAYATGVSVICLIDVFATGRPGLRHRRPMILASVLISASSVAVVVALVAAVTMVAIRVPELADEAEVVLRLARSSRTWIVILGLLLVIGHLWSGRGRDADGASSRGRIASTPDWDNVDDCERIEGELEPRHQE